MIQLTAKNDAKPQPIAMTEAEMKKYIGKYGDALEIVLQDGKLMSKRGSTFTPIQKLSESRFATAGMEFVVVLDADGNAEFLHTGGRTMRKNK